MKTHWGTFNKAVHLAGCHIIAQNALAAEGLPAVDTSGDGSQFLLGVGAQAMVTVFLEPVAASDTRITVVAHSDDSAAAESARNRVRARIISG